MLPRLTRRFRVVAYDARGHGRSQKPTGGYGFDTVVADAVAVMRETRLRCPVMAGHSWGAMTALELAARHPRELGAAVLVDGGTVRLRDEMDWATTKERLAPPDLAGMRVEDFLGMLRTIFAGSVEVTADVEEIALSVMRVGRDGTIRANLSRANHFRILRAIWEQDPLALYPRLRVPTLVIVALQEEDEDDPFVQSKRAALTAVRRAGRDSPVTIARMEGIHDLPLQRPDALARRIARFAREAVP